MQKAKKVIIVGGGLAGLACAQTLQAKGVRFSLIESTERVGGRIKTEILPGGFQVDRGFQVLLNSYPELPRFLDLKHLKLQTFNSGALIYRGDSLTLLANPIKHPSQFFPTLFSSAISLRDKLLVSKLVIRASFDHTSNLNITTLDFLKQFGFSVHFIELFWKPFFTGVFLDPTLSPDASYFLFLLRCFALGSVSLPALGMEEIPKQIMSHLTKSNFIFNTQVLESQAEGVRLSNGDFLESDFVVDSTPRFNEHAHSVTTYSFATSTKLKLGRWLVLIPSHLNININHLAVMSEVASSYAPNGQTLISASVVRPGTLPTVDLIKSEIERVAKTPLELTHLRTDTVSHALPQYLSLPAQFKAEGALYFCGDYLSQPSINGALKSGRLAGEAILRKLST